MKIKRWIINSKGNNKRCYHTMPVIHFQMSSMGNYSSEFIGRDKLECWRVTIEGKRFIRSQKRNSLG